MDRNHRRGPRVFVAVLGLLLVVALAAPALAQNEPYGNGGPTVLPTLITNPSDPVVEPNREERPPGVLPFTGGDVTLFLVIGLGAISAGVVMLRGRKAPGSK